MTQCVRAQAPSIASGGVLNAADGSREIAPGSFFSVYCGAGSSFAPSNIVAPSIPLLAALGGISVDVVDAGRTLAAPVWFVSPCQINAQMPFGISGTSVQVVVRSAAGTSNSEAGTIVSRSPRFFSRDSTGKGEAILLHRDFTLVSEASPAFPGETVLGYMNGLGAVTPALEAGQPGAAAAPLNTADPVQVAVAGRPAQASLFAGMAPNFLIYQVDFRIPEDAPTGRQPIAVTAGPGQSQSGVFVWIGGNFRTVRAEVPYFTCLATDFTRNPAVVFGVTCPSTAVGNLMNTQQFKAGIPLVWNQAGTTFSASGSIRGANAADRCDVAITGQLDPQRDTVVTARFRETCHTEDPATLLVRDIEQDYTFANVPVSSNLPGYSLPFRATGTAARRAVTDIGFKGTVKREDGSLFLTWDYFEAPAAGPADAALVGFIQ